MSFIGNKILLGYEDEPINEKYKEHVNFKTNKIGGKPNWKFPSPVRCKICGLATPLVIQIYAPMKNSQFHRTLFIFACINPSCWNNKESWVCLRTQMLDYPTAVEDVKNKVNSNSESFMCSGSETWGDDDEDNENADYLNDFIRNRNDYSEFNVSEIDHGISQMCFEEEVNNDTLETSVKETYNSAVAMIEGNIGEVCIDTPTIPISDLNSLLQQPNTLPSIPDGDFEFSSFFISVDEENLSRIGLSDEESIISKIRDYRMNLGGEEDMAMSISGENYEKSIPAHGDKMFHRFLTRIQANPSQIIRYGGFPLWLYSPEENCSQLRCKYCGGESAFEMQILPTLIPRLCFNGSSGHLEFGSVFIYSCLSGCWDINDPQPRNEFVIVQRERM